MREFVFGTRAAGSLQTPHALELGWASDLELRATQLHYAVIEIAAEQARAAVPPSLHPTAPGLVSLHVWNVAGGDLGSFTLGMVGIVTRTNYKPRHLIASAFASSSQACAALGSRFGFPVQLADVEQREYHDAVLSKISHEGRVLLDISTHEMQLILGSAAALKIAPLLVPAKIDDLPSLVQVETSYDFKTTRRGKPIVHAFEADALGLSDVRLGMPALSAHAVVDIVLHPPRFSLDLQRPAEQQPSIRLRERVPAG